MVTSPASSTPKADTPSKAPTERVSEGISAFLARVLDQLSITAWLPAVFLVGNAAVLLALQGQVHLNLSTAIQSLVDLRWGAIIILIFAIIIIAMVIQAFEFESLRFWEGYFRSAWLRSWSARRIKAAQRLQVQLQKDCQLLERKAFDGARQYALDNLRATIDNSDIRKKVKKEWDAMEKVIHGRRLDKGEGKYADSAALTLNWPSHADPVALHEWDILRLKLAEYPEPHRLLPTRLGNVMRASEDEVTLGPGEDLEGFMIRHLNDLPAAVVAEHAAYRRRLEMYCGLMFVLMALALFSVGCLWGYTNDWGWRLAVPLLYLSAVVVSYRAAIASALGFGQALREANRCITERTQTTSPAS